jgi:hypothetical protein
VLYALGSSSGGLTCYLDDGHLCYEYNTCLGAPVSLDYYDRAPFPFTGTIDAVNVRYTSEPFDIAAGSTHPPQGST